VLTVELLLLIWLMLAACPVAFFAVQTCCCGCIYFSDKFAVDNLATDYTTVSGTWAVGAGKLTTSSGNALLLTNATSVSNHGSMGATVTLGVDGDVAIVLVSYLDANNYVFVELTQGATTLTARLYQRSGGSNTQLGFTALGTNTPGSEFATMPPGTAFSVIVCAGNTTTTVSVNGFCIAGRNADYSRGNRAGVGTGSVTGSVTFDNISFLKVPADDPVCGQCCFNCAGNCDLGTFPTTVELTVNGITGFFGICSDADCNFYNHTYILDRIEQGTFFSGCLYRFAYADPTLPCGRFFGEAWTFDATIVAGTTGIQWLISAYFGTSTTCPRFGASTTVAAGDCLQTVTGTFTGVPGLCGCEVVGATFTLVPKL
jgi:hypothetical protein